MNVQFKPALSGMSRWRLRCVVGRLPVIGEHQRVVGDGTQRIGVARHAAHRHVFERQAYHGRGEFEWFRADYVVQRELWIATAAILCVFCFKKEKNWKYLIQIKCVIQKNNNLLEMQQHLPQCRARREKRTAQWWAGHPNDDSTRI